MDNNNDKINLTVFTFEDLSVGILGNAIPVTIQFSPEYWNGLNQAEQLEIISMLKEAVVNIIDPIHGTCKTQEEIDAENETYERMDNNF